MSGPLAGIRILDFTIFQAGAEGTALLADLGADVIKVEDTGRGEPGRYLYLIGPPGERESAFFYVCNRGKRSLSLDLKRPEAIEVIERLVPQVDVVTHNFRPGVMERLNLSYERLRALNSKLVYVSVTGWGKRGPKVTHPALDHAAQARGGLVWQTGEPEGFPVPVGVAAADYAGAMNLAIAVLSGIVARDRTGQGQAIDFSLFGTVLAMQAPELTYALFTGRKLTRAGRGHPILPTITRVFEASDGYLVVMAVDDPRWAGFCRALGHADLEHDERFKDARARKRNMAVLYEELDRIFPTRTRDEWIARMEAEDQICAPVQSYDEVAKDPVAIENHYLREVEHPRLGRGKLVTFPFEFGTTPISCDSFDPVLGEHTREVLTSAGLSPEEVDSLISRGIARQASAGKRS